MRHSTQFYSAQKLGVITLATAVTIAGAAHLFTSADELRGPMAQNFVPNSRYSTLLSERYTSYKANANIDVMQYKSQVDAMTNMASDIAKAKFTAKTSLEDVKNTVSGMHFSDDGYAVLTDNSGSIVYDPMSKDSSKYSVIEATEAGGYFAAYDAKTCSVKAAGSTAIADTGYNITVCVEYPVDGQTAEPEPQQPQQEVTEQKTLYTTSNVNVRATASTSGSILGIASKDEAITVVGSASSKWAAVEYNGQKAYIATEFLTDQEPEPEPQQQPEQEQEQKQKQPQQEDQQSEQQEVAPTGGIEVIDVQTADDVPASEVGIVKADGNVSRGLLQYANDIMGRVPSAVLNSFTQQGWSIYVTDSDLNARFFNNQYGGVSGATIYGEQAIYVNASRFNINDAMVHEFGHFIDCNAGYVSYTQEFIDIYNEEKNTFKYTNSCGDGHEFSNAQEFFASVFDEYIINPSGCQATAPKAYDYITRTLASYGG